MRSEKLNDRETDKSKDQNFHISACICFAERISESEKERERNGDSDRERRVQRFEREGEETKPL